MAERELWLLPLLYGDGIHLSAADHEDSEGRSLSGRTIYDVLESRNEYSGILQGDNG